MNNNYQHSIGQMQPQSNTINPTQYQQLMQQQNQVNLSGKIENLIKLTNTCETGLYFNPQKKIMDIQNNNQSIYPPSQAQLLNQKEQKQDRSFLGKLLQQQMLQNPPYLQQQPFSTQNILSRDINQQIINSQITQPTLIEQNYQNQILLSQIGDYNKVNTVSYLQPTSVNHSIQEINNLNQKFQGLNLQNDSFLASQSNQQNIIQLQQAPQQLQQQQQLFQYPQNQQNLQSHNLLNFGSNNQIRSMTTIGSHNDLQSGLEYFTTTPIPGRDFQQIDQNTNLRMILNQQQQNLYNPLINQQNQQIISTQYQQLQPRQQLNQPQQQLNIPNSFIQLQGNQHSNIHQNSLNINPIQQISTNMILQSDQIQQISANPHLQKYLKNDMEVNQQILQTNLNEIHLKGQQMNSRGEINTSFLSLLKSNNNLQNTIIQNNQNSNLPGNISIEDKIGSIQYKYQKIEEGQQYYSDRAIQSNSHLPQTQPSLSQINNLSQNQIHSNPSFLSLKHQSSQTQSEKLDEGQQIFQNSSYRNSIPSLIELESQQTHKNQVLKFKFQQNPQQTVNDNLFLYENRAILNNKIGTEIYTSENIYTDHKKISENHHFQQSSDKDENVISEDSHIENSSKNINSNNKLESTSIPQMEMNKKSLKAKYLQIYQSSSHSPVKNKKRKSSSTLLFKKESKIFDKQIEKCSTQEIKSHELLTQLSNEEQLESNKLESKRNNSDPYQNYFYYSQVQNQLRKQVLKCFFKNVPTYLTKYESEIANLHLNFDKNSLLSICKYWSQFDNPTKRQNLKNDEYKALCETLGINNEIKPLGQKGLKEVFCKNNHFSDALKFLYKKFNGDSQLFAKKQRKIEMTIFYSETSQQIHDEIFN